MPMPSTLSPSPHLSDVRAYRVPRARAPIDLRLDGNEGRAPGNDLFAALDELPAGTLSRYPDVSDLCAHIADAFALDPSRVILSAGADEVLDRICRAMLAPGREVVLLEPGFEMLPRYARLAGARVVEVRWPDAGFPLDALRSAMTPATSLVVLTSPNNPTGALVPPEALRTLAAAFPHCLFAVDEAYAEFGDEVAQVPSSADGPWHAPTALPQTALPQTALPQTALAKTALSLDNAVLVRTLSKAWGLAGLRVGFALAKQASLVDWLRAAGSPYPVSTISAVLAHARLRQGAEEMNGFVERVREERTTLRDALRALHAEPLPSQANFVFARFPGSHERPLWLRDGLAGIGVGVRAFPGRAHCEDAVRITCPGGAAPFARLLHGMYATLAPEALLFDLDGVLADVGQSYRAAILESAADFGVTLTPEDIDAEKRAGHANDDWELTWRLVHARGGHATLEEVTAAFERLYQGTSQRPGFKLRETLLVPRALLASLRAQRPLAIVTGRPRGDAHEFLERHALRELFDVVVTREDARLKPDPEPVLLALARLGVRSAWMVGDTPDDVRAARSAQVIPLGVLPPGVAGGGPLEDALFAAGAARVFGSAIDFAGFALDAAAGPTPPPTFFERTS